jgi:hypothetical protein
MKNAKRIEKLRESMLDEHFEFASWVMGFIRELNDLRKRLEAVEARDKGGSI